ncbi:MAG: hypothetical protein JWN38_768 [Candidatus Saccharibacteria bacterium]|nr:hypothetical protein [Candidatus Saccharibacteria bacterium]
MPTVYVRGVPHKLPAKSLIGKGGEADIYKLDDSRVLKLYKRPTDPDYTGNLVAQQGASNRIKEQQVKLPRFPKGLPPNVVSPIDLAHDKTGGEIVGYTMNYLDGMEVLLRYGDKQYREQGGIDGNSVVAVFRSLHQLVTQVHAAQVVIGDFNDLNVLVDGQRQVHLVDADSMQFGPFFCQAYTTRFVDPLLCDRTALQLIQPHSPRSDWYAYLIMLCQSLLYTGPYGGVHRPPSGKRLQHDDRVLQRLTFFNPDVIYPKPAIPYGSLPDELLQYLHRVLEQDAREVFPLRLLDNTRWTTCTNCSALHARSVCPNCAKPGAVKQTTVVRGTVTATRVFQTPTGRILHAAFQGGKLRYLYHEADTFRREDGRTVLPGALDPELRFRINGATSLLGKRDRLIVLDPAAPAPEIVPTEAYRKLAMFDANEYHRYWIQSGQLVRNDTLGSFYIGDVLSDQTLFWVGKRFGFGFYQAGQLLRAFVFDATKRQLNDRVAIDSLAGQLVDATCVFADDRAWFMVSTQTGGQLLNRCFVINARGDVLATATAQQGDNSWLAGGIRGHLAMGDALYAATDDGIVRLATDNGTVVVERTFPDTEPFVSTASQLVPSPEGIYAVSTREITLLKIR